MQMSAPMAICNYDVFLSFRGPDVRDSFLECFCEQLSGARIVYFLDSKEIEYGDPIDDKIVEAIKRSSICVPIFSQDFATSPACLMEVAQMMESRKTILPIFYGVKPSVVRHQLKPYEASFAIHEFKKRYPQPTIEKWKDALKEIPEDLGPEFMNVSSGYHTRLGDFVCKLLNLLRMNHPDVPEDLVGIDEHVPEMMRKLGFDYQHGRVVEKEEITGRWVCVVHGMSGVGKTTLAWVVFEKIRLHFGEYCCFLENVGDEIKQKGVVSLQNRLIRGLKRGGICPTVDTEIQGAGMIRKLFRESRVLIVLDDVDDYQQIKSLAEVTWFGQKSRIILTTTKKNVYKVQKSEEQGILHENEHEISSMNEYHALELLCKRAFGKNHPPKGYDDEMLRKIITALGNLPFAIDFVGRYLNGESEDKWRESEHDLQVALEDEVKKLLEKNYESLRPNIKEVFLDIACFFTGVEKTIPCHMWAARQRVLRTGVDELQEKSFLKIGEKNQFWMHKQLKLLGREIVKSESLNNPGERSRLWDYEDVQTTLRNRKGTSKVGALRVTYTDDFKQVEGEALCDLSNLRFLELDSVDIEGNPENLLPHLLWLDWRKCPNKSKLFAFDMENLVILNLCSSQVQLTLEDWKQLMEKAQRLEVLNLKDCSWINASLEFPASSLLKCLILEGCLYLKPNETILNFENLVSLNMKHCKGVKCLPQALCSMKELKELLIDGTEIEELQFREDSLPALEILSACECARLREVSDSIRFLKSLQKLTLRSCNRLKTLPHVFGELVQLQEMDFSRTSINELPSCVKDCKRLRVLKMVRTFLKEFPEAIKDLKELKELDFNLCGILSGLCDIRGLFSLRILRLKHTGISQVLAREGQFCLHILELNHGVTWQTQTSQRECSVSQHKRKRDEE